VAREGQAARLVGRYALPREFVRSFSDVRVNLGAQIGVALLSAKPPDQPRQKDAQAAHGSSS